jgi:hypothetical protein
MSSVIMTLGLSDGGLSDGALSDGMVIKSDIDGILPRGLVMLTLTLAAGVASIEGDPGRGMRAGEICGTTSVSSHVS